MQKSKVVIILTDISNFNSESILNEIIIINSQYEVTKAIRTELRHQHFGALENFEKALKCGLINVKQTFEVPNI